jgi:hypothetical protein
MHRKSVVKINAPALIVGGERDRAGFRTTSPIRSFHRIGSDEVCHIPDQMRSVTSRRLRNAMRKATRRTPDNLNFC